MFVNVIVLTDNMETTIGHANVSNERVEMGGGVSATAPSGSMFTSC
jgi:hypothetical protein